MFSYTIGSKYIGSSSLAAACGSGAYGAGEIWTAEEAHGEHPGVAGGHQPAAGQDGGRVQRPDAGHCECIQTNTNNTEWENDAPCDFVCCLNV